MNKIILTRKNKPLWEFCWEDKYSGYIHKTKNNTIYKVFFDNCVNLSKYGKKPDIWIGKLSLDKKSWYTCEKDIKAESLIMFRGQYNFN